MTVKNNQSILFILPAVFSILALFAIVQWGLKPGIDLAGGSMLQVSFDERPKIEEVKSLRYAVFIEVIVNEQPPRRRGTWRASRPRHQKFQTKLPLTA